MQAGHLNRRITLQQRTAGQDATGQPVQTWTDVATVWAGIKAKTGRELDLAKSVQSEVSHTITIRYRTGISAAMRAVLGTRIFNIAAVIDRYDAHRFLQLEVSEGVNNG